MKLVASSMSAYGRPTMFKEILALQEWCSADKEILNDINNIYLVLYLTVNIIIHLLVLRLKEMHPVQ